jgi:dihydrofolate reductase
MTKHRIFTTSFATVYPLYIQKAERKGRTKEEVDQIICWLRRNSVMRKVIVLEHISLDGVIQAPGGPDEDTSGGFAYGGWIAPYSDAICLARLLRRQMNLPFDLLLGRKTFDIWAPYWPHHGDIWPGVNAATKYVASNTMTSGEWQPSVFLSGDIAEKVAKSSNSQGRICTFGEVVISFRRLSSMIWSMCSG